MANVILAGDPQITITLKRYARARRLSLRVSALDGRVTMSLPSWTAEAEAMGFLREKEHWIRRQLTRQIPRVSPITDGKILFEGREVPILTSAGRSVKYVQGALLVPDDPEKAPARLAAFLKAMARQRLVSACDHYVNLLGRGYGRISLRDTRSRWGSCSSDGNLMFSWRLILAPPEVLQYVAAHEVAHLAEMNHSTAFWNVVEQICPTYRSTRSWLRNNGQKLHGYRFTN